MNLPKWNLTLKKEEFHSYQEEIVRANLNAMFRISAIGTGICILLVLLSMPILGVLELFESYMILMMIFLTVAVLSKTVLKTHTEWILPVYYALLLFLYGIAIHMGTVQGKNTNATTFLIFLLLLPLLMIDYPWRMNLVNAVCTVFFMIVDSKVKAPGDILSLDLSNAVIVYCVSAVFYMVSTVRQIDSFAIKYKEENEIQEKNKLINSLPVGVGVYEVKGTDIQQVFLNDEFYRLFEDTKEARSKRTQGDFMNSIHPDDRAKLRRAIQAVIAGEDYISQPCRSMKGDGTYLWVRFSSAAVERDEDHLFVYSVYSSMEEEMRSRQATQAKTDFLSRVSHDMRTPLNGILGLTTLLKDKVKEHDQLQDLQQLQLSGQYLLNLINDTLDVSRIESGKLELNPVVCDGRDVFNNVLSLAKPNLQDKNIQFHVKAENLPFTTLFIDVGRVEQIVMNVLGNAIKFTPNGGDIEFIMENLSMENGVILDRITIKDSGIGMAPEFLPHLFEPFSQENNGKTNSYQGTGLGMTITKQIIELMGGEIHVESEIGQGTSFSFTIPLPMATPEQILEKKETTVIKLSNHALEGKRALLFEDHPLNAQIATRLLEKKGMSVEHAENGQIGVEMFKKSPLHYYDVILMDIRMPVMDGLQATREIRSLPRADATQIPIVAMTANAFDEDVRQTKEAGMDAHLGKPIETDKLFDTLEQMMHLNRAMKKQMILIVDDMELNRAIIKEALNGEYTIIEATNGEEALEALDKYKGIDAVITDIQMPEMDGIELIRKMRKNTNYRNIAIIANTQYGAPKQEERLLEIGADEFVYKPTTPKILALRLYNVLRSKR